MKKILFISLMVLSMSLSATAIYDPNNTVKSTDEKVQGDVKVTKLDAKEITNHNLDFMHMEGRCGSVDGDRASISPRKISSGNNTLKIEGVFQTPHPRYNLTGEVEKTGEKQYILRVKGVETSKVAPRCIGNINYHAHFTAPENSTLEVYHNQSKIGEKKISGLEKTGKNPEEALDKEQEQEGIIKKTAKLFQGLF
jgi:hypothetical protein